MNDESGKRLVFGDLVDKVFWGLIIVIAGWTGTEIRNLSDNLQQVNITVTNATAEFKATRSIVDKIVAVQERQEDRLRLLEIKSYNEKK